MKTIISTPKAPAAIRTIFTGGSREWNAFYIRSYTYRS